MDDLKSRALNQLRAWAEKGMADECYGIERLAKALNCEEKDLFDKDYDSGVLFELSQEGHVSFTTCRTCVMPVGRVVSWEF